MDMSLSKLREDRGAWRAAVAKSQTQLSDWTTTKWPHKSKNSFGGKVENQKASWGKFEPTKEVL